MSWLQVATALVGPPQNCAASSVPARVGLTLLPADRLDLVELRGIGRLVSGNGPREKKRSGVLEQNG